MKHRLETYMPNKHKIMANLFRRILSFISIRSRSRSSCPSSASSATSASARPCSASGRAGTSPRPCTFASSLFQRWIWWWWHWCLTCFHLPRLVLEIWSLPRASLAMRYRQTTPSPSPLHCCPPQCDRRASMESSKWWFVWPTVWPVWHCSPCACP